MTLRSDTKIAREQQQRQPLAIRLSRETDAFRGAENFKEREEYRELHRLQNQAILENKPWRPAWNERLLSHDLQLPIKDSYVDDIRKNDEDLLRERQQHDTFCSLIRHFLDTAERSLIEHLPAFLMRYALSGRFYLENDILCFREGAVRNDFEGAVSAANCECFEGRQRTLRVAPSALRSSILDLAHSAPIHHGGSKMIRIIRDKLGYWWPKMAQHARAYATCCNTCQHVKDGNFARYKETGHLQQFSATTPFQQISVDIVGPLPLCETGRGDQYIVTMIDSFSRFCLLDPAPEVTADTVIRSIDRWIATFGAPESILSDNGPQFISAIYRHFMEAHGVKVQFTSTYHPCCNGKIERLHRWIKERLRCIAYDGGKNFVNGKDDWARYLPAIQYAYNSTPNRMTTYSPRDIVFGEQPRSVHDYSFTASTPSEYVEYLQKRQKILLQTANAAQRRYDRLRRAKYAKQRRAKPFEPGTKVLWNIHAQFKGNLKKLGPRWIGPYEVVETFNNGQSLTVKLCDLDEDEDHYMNRLKIPRRGNVIEDVVRDDDGVLVQVFTIPRSQVKPYYEAFEARFDGNASPATIAVRFLKHEIIAQRTREVVRSPTSIMVLRSNHDLPVALHYSDFEVFPKPAVHRAIRHSVANVLSTTTERRYHNMFVLGSVLEPR